VIIGVFILVGLLIVENLPLWVLRLDIFPAVAAAILVSLVLLFWWRGEAFVDWWVLRSLPPRFGSNLKSVLASVADGMRVIPNPRLLLAVFLVSLSLWFLPILSSYIMILAFYLHAPIRASLVYFLVVGFPSPLPT